MTQQHLSALAQQQKYLRACGDDPAATLVRERPRAKSSKPVKVQTGVDGFSALECYGASPYLQHKRATPEQQGGVSLVSKKHPTYKLMRRPLTAALLLGFSTALKPPPIQAFLAGASPQAQQEYAALQDAFPASASSDVQLEWRAFEQVFAGRQASGSSEVAWAQQEAFERRGDVYELEPHEPDQLASAVRRNGNCGVARLPRAIDADKANALRAHVLRARDEEAPLLGDILGPSDNSIPNAPRTRWDVFMDPADAPVAAVIQQLLTGPVGAAFAELCGPDAVLRECSAVVSAPGAPPQPCHSDTKWTEDLVLATCFVALQDIGPELGPTRFLPNTATSKAHASLADALSASDAAAAVVKYAETVSQLAILDVGDATLYESRLQHAGTPNFGDRDRVLFYVSFGRAPEDAPTSISPAVAARGLRLGGFRR